MQPVEITSGGRTLAGNFFYPADRYDNLPVVLLIHGWASAKERYFGLAEKLSESGFVCLAFDLSGHGKSGGDINTLTREDFLNDVVAAYDFLGRGRGIDAKNITIVGSSWGAYLGALLTSERAVARIALRVPADYPNEGFDAPQILQSGERPKAIKWRAEPRQSDATRALHAIHQFTGGVLIVESGKDEIVPHQTIVNYMQAVADKRQLTHVVMENAPHSLSGHENFIQEFEKILCGWLLQ